MIIKESNKDVPADSFTEWQDAYIGDLSSYESEIAGCELAYLNDDDIPELFAYQDERFYHLKGVKIYTFVDGKVRQVGEYEYGYYGMKE